MECPGCGRAAREDARFCDGCGSPLARACPSCGRDLRPDARFCDGCGAATAAPVPPERLERALPERTPRDYTPRHLADKILSQKSALEGERKQVSVLFADVKGSMDLAEGLDPEEWHRIMDRFFQILADGVHRFEGTVNQYTGDGIMALFGAPIAHEDHAQRACYAAMHLREELRRYAEELKRTQGLGFSVRMGLNSGEVIVGKIGDDLRMDYTAQGHTVGLAARIGELAAPDNAYLAEDTAKLAAGFFALRDLGLFNLKGVREPVRVYELEGVGPVRTRLEVARSRGFSRFVGRTDEMSTLDLALKRVTEGHGQVVGVVGEAGVGKSRLCLEFVEHCRTKGLSVYEAHCPAHGRMLPFLPFLELLRAYFRVTERDSDQLAREKIAGRLVLLERSFEETLPLLFDFLGVRDPDRPLPGMGPEARERQLFDFIRALVQSWSQHEPPVLLIDDLHWIDSGSDACLAQLVEAIGGTRTLLLLNFRPEYHADWLGKSYYQQLPLVPLGPEAMSEMLDDLLGDDPSVAALCDLIRERTGGNPFFIEEVVQSLVESGSLEGSRRRYRLTQAVGELEIPPTVQAVLAARIDRLPEREKQVIQTAAVIGKRFSEPILKRVAEASDAELTASLSALQAGEYIFEEALYPEAVYAFKHPLVQEVAYGSQLGERRAHVHAAVARALEAASSGQPNETAALLAHHWEAAGDAFEAARWHGRAARWVGSSNAAEAMRHWRKVRTLLAKVPESEKTLALGVAARGQIFNWSVRVGISPKEADALFAEGRDLATRLGDTRLTSMLEAGYGAAKGSQGHTQAHLEHALEAVRLADQTNDVAWQLASRAPLLWALWSVGRLREAVARADEALERFPHDPQLGAHFNGFSPYLMIRHHRATPLAFMGRSREAVPELERVLSLARKEGDLEVSYLAQATLSEAAFWQGDARKCLSHARRVDETAEKVRPVGRLGRSLLGRAYVLNEEWSDAVRELEEALLPEGGRGPSRMGGPVGAPSVTPWSEHALLARAYLGLGDLERARARAEEAVAFAARSRRPLEQVEGRLALAQVRLRVEGEGAADAIEDLLAGALSLVEEMEARRYEPFVRAQRAELARLRGDLATAERELREAQRLFVEMGATPHAERVARELAETGA